jgi:lysine/ornithine N-monooxygenase
MKKMEGNMTDTDVTIIGAGPYGLSAAAHLRQVGIEARIFGKPMEFWADKMPAGMVLRSPRPASTISDPSSKFTLEAYESANGVTPVQRTPLETFVDYGRWFEKQIGCDLDQRNIKTVTKQNSVFRVVLEGGAQFTTRRVVVAAGVGSFRRIPAPYTGLSEKACSHCYDGRKFPAMGRRVAVIGAGQSALECAALLSEAGAEVEVIARERVLRWIGMHPKLHRLGPISKTLYSKHDIGPMGISRLVAYPHVLYHTPRGWRDRIRTRAVRSAGAPWLIPRLANTKITTGRKVVSAAEVGNEVRLTLDDNSERRVDHVLLGTGYSVDISKYKFLSPELIQEIEQFDGYPKVGPGFHSSVSGLHFLGAPAARSFGPLLYFVTGTEFASKELSSYLSRNQN